MELFPDLQKRYTKDVYSAREAQRFAELIAFGPVVFQASRLMVKYGILDLLREHPEFSASKLAAAVGITAKGVERHLAHLKAAGIIRREGPAKGGKWVVVSG